MMMNAYIMLISFSTAFSIITTFIVESCVATFIVET